MIAPRFPWLARSRRLLVASSTAPASPLSHASRVCSSFGCSAGAELTERYEATQDAAGTGRPVLAFRMSVRKGYRSMDL
jgi:hypothetical protein